MIIGLTGRKGSGKNEAALALADFTEVKFAGCLKEMTRTFLRFQGCSDAMIERMVEGDLKEVPSMQYIGGKTCREFQQFLGTEFGRNLLHEDIWVSCAINSAKAVEGNVVFTDARFPNEIKAIEEMGGTTVRIERNALLLNEFSDHPSETAIDTLDVANVIQNDGTVEDLHRAIKEII